MNNNNQFEIKKIVDTKGKEHIIALECDIKGRNFIITTDKKIFEKDEKGKIKECINKNDETEFLLRYVKEPESLDIEL